MILIYKSMRSIESIVFFQRILYFGCHYQPDEMFVNVACYKCLNTHYSFGERDLRVGHKPKMCTSVSIESEENGKK